MAKNMKLARPPTSEPDTLEDLVTCSVCYEIYTDPKILECLHTFCEPCIARLPKRRGNKGMRIHCPLCKQETALPSGGAKSLKHDFKSAKMAGILGKPRKGDVASSLDQNCDKPCGACGKESEFCCIECLLSFCADCVEDHNEDSMNADHCVVEMGSHMLCENHPGSVVTVHCMSCGQSMCSVCSMKHDRSHTREKIEQSKNRRKKLQDNSDDLSKSLVVIEKKQEEIALIRKLHDSMKTNITGKICDFATGLITKLVKLRDSSVNEIDRIAGESMNAIDHDIKADEASEKVNELLSEMAGTIAGNPQDCLMSFTDLSERYEAIRDEGIEDKDVPQIVEIEENLSKSVDGVIDQFCQDLKGFCSEINFDVLKNDLNVRQNKGFNHTGNEELLGTERDKLTTDSSGGPRIL